MFLFRNKKILIVSPQPWSHLYVSKHHYAMELSRNNEVWFLSAPEVQKKKFSWKIEKEKNHNSLFLVRYSIPLPLLLLFHVPALYKRINLWYVRKKLKKTCTEFDICIDFGNYQLYKNLSFVRAKLKLYFPVDDFENLPLTKRGCHYCFSVSHQIIKKLSAKGIECSFINHGLGEDFAHLSEQRLKNMQPWLQQLKIKVGYAGNLFIPFLDVVTFRKLIVENTEVEFYFWGDTRFNHNDIRHTTWFSFLKASPNVFLMGVLSPQELAFELSKMDACILCYKPDNKNFHGENSHKIFEYLSTGRVIISTPISLYSDSDLFCMSREKDNTDFPETFKNALNNLSLYNSLELSKRRMELALDNIYRRQIQRMESFITEKTGGV